MQIFPSKSGNFILIKTHPTPLIHFMYLIARRRRCAHKRVLLMTYTSKLCWSKSMHKNAHQIFSHPPAALLRDVHEFKISFHFHDKRRTEMIDSKKDRMDYRAGEMASAANSSSDSMEWR